MIRSALEYHRGTGYDRKRMSGHYLDWSNQPRPFKLYPGLPVIALPQIDEWPEDRLSDLLSLERPLSSEIEIDLMLVTRILRLTHTVTATAKHGGTDFYFRSVASAGALYPFELYVGTNNVSGLEDGLYHYSLGSDALTLLRSGNVLLDLSGAMTLGNSSGPTLVFFLSSIFFRSSWKYRDRAYRYHLLDTGHMVENLALALSSTRIPHQVHYDFDDRTINEILTLDDGKEACLAVITAQEKPYGESATGPLVPADADLRQASRVAAEESDYPMIREMHSASSSIEYLGIPRQRMMTGLGLTLDSKLPIPEVVSSPEVMNYPKAVFRRRSYRNFVREPAEMQSFASVLKMLCSKPTTNMHEERMPEWSVEVGFIASRVADLDSGFYLLDRNDETIHLVSKKPSTENAAHACLDQAWLAGCSLHFLFLSNLRLLDETCGARGYRYAMLTAGRFGQRLYLASVAVQWGCCGIGAFYDREAAGILGLNNDSELLYLVGAGPIKKSF